MTLTGEYAVRAMIHLARHRDEFPIPGWQIAEQANIPAKYLSKILGDLVRSGLLDSSPGKTGGFRMRRSAAETSLYDVLDPFEPFERKRCPFGNVKCCEENPCAAHEGWSLVVKAEEAFFRNTTIEDIADAPDS